jgi:hypothetical protein
LAREHGKTPEASNVLRWIFVGVRQIRRLACVLLVAALTGVPSVASAKLFVLPPEEIIRSAVIVVGTVSSRVQKEERLDVSIRVERVLSGSVDERSVSVSVGPYLPRGGAPDVFPEVGTRIIVALSSDEDGWRLASDLNSVGLIRDGHVTGLYKKGSKVTLNDATWEPDDYVSAYEQFYRSHMGWFERWFEPAVEWLKELLR